MKNALHKPILLLLCAVLVFSLCLTGCDSKEPNFPVALSDMTRSAFELNTDQLKDSDLEQIYQDMLDGETVKQLNESQEIRCLRKSDDGYRVIYTGNTRALVLRFDNDGSWIRTDRLQTLYRIAPTRGKFDALAVGDPVSKVQTADPTCYFPFLADKTSTDLESNHYTGDGYHTRILYDADFNIISVTSELM
ncbi:MAG: hypothetical protein IJH07_04405 [Ruminococcus sp.]|nr:hypothetical protein [Ruminococcus sp.]